MSSSGAIYYRKGYKYQLDETCWVSTLIRDINVTDGTVGVVAKIEGGQLYAMLKSDGTLTIYAGYAWDGPSGPAPDFANSMRASLYHDVLYQMLRAGSLRQGLRAAADSLYRTTLIEDGMNVTLAGVEYEALRLLGERAASVQPTRIYTAP